MDSLLGPEGKLTAIVFAFFPPEELFVYSRLQPKNDLIRALAGEITAQESADHAAAQDWTDGLEFLAAVEYSSHRIDMDAVLFVAATAGHCTSMKIAKKWGARCVNDVIEYAAKGGHICALELLKTWGGDQFDYAFWPAAEHGHIEALKWAKDQGMRDTDRDSAQYGAAFGGQISVMYLVKEWGAEDADRSLGWAAYGGRLAAMELAKAWGANDFNRALCNAARDNQIAAMRLLKAWGATDFYGATPDAGARNSSGTIRLLEEWAAEK